MPLQFQCNQDPRKMKSGNGKKFCEQCSHHVYDVRRKSVDKIVELKNERGACCVIIYEDQLVKVEQRIKLRNTGAPRKFAPFSIAAGLTAFALIPGIIHSQVNSINSAIEIKDSQGKTNPIQKKQKENKLNSDSLVLIKGRVQSSVKKFGKKHKLTLGYYLSNDSESVFVPIKEFESSRSGKFEFTLTKSEVKLLMLNGYLVECGKFNVWTDDYDFDKPVGEFILSVHHRRMVVGKF